MKQLKRTLAVFLVLCLLFSALPATALAGTDASATSTEEDNFERILHLDCGRKYFTKDWIIALINEMAAAGYTHLQLAFGNDGMRFLLDDMSVTVNNTTYSSANVTAGIQAGNNEYYDAGDKNELTEDEMDDIIAYAKKVGIEIIPHVNMPGHMDAILDAIEYVGISDAHFTGYTESARSLNLNNDTAVAFAQALLEKYVAYFDAKGCKYFHIGADEYANDAYGSSMGFPSMGSTLYAKFAEYVNACAAIVKNAGMIPRAWNDGISYGSYTNSFDTDIQITYWSSGWRGYDVASSSTLASKGHKMINTHGSYYFILTSNGITNPSDSALNFDNNTFMDSTISDPVGSMFCIWCDAPGSATEQEVAAAVRITLRKMAAAMKGADTYSTEVVPGGFNADGTIAETRSWNTVTDPATGISVSGYDLNSLSVIEATAPSIEGAVETLAWDITPATDEGAYTSERGTVALPVPEDWDAKLVRGFYVENGVAKLVTGTYADGKYTFNMPHFSVGGVVLLDATSVYDELIELNVGDTETVLVDTTITADNITFTTPSVASVTTTPNSTQAEKSLQKVESLSDIVSGGKYVLVNTRSGNVLGDETGYAYTWDTTCLVQDDESASVNSSYWTITASGSNYTLKNADGSYMTIGDNSSDLTSTSTNLVIYDYKNGTFGVAQNGYYLNDMGGAGQFAGGYNVQDDPGAPWYLYHIVETQAVNGTNVTFKGEAKGETMTTINGVTYKIVVHGTTDITIKYATEDGTIIKTETKTVADNATTHTVSNFNYNSKYYVVDSTTLNISPSTTSEYTVTVTETEEDLTQVPNLTIEFWQTNAVVVATQGGSDNTKTVTAESAYSENGIALSAIIPVTAYKQDGSASDPALGYWRSRLLLKSTNEQTGDNGDDETQSGTGFTKVRYWNGSWAVYTDAGEWQDIVPANYQLVAYYMNDMHLANEVSVSTSDWGKKGNGEFAGTYLSSNNVSLAFQVVYEGGTTAPAGVGTELAPYTYFVDAWGNRGVGAVAINKLGDYQIWKITAETGEHNVTHNGNHSAITVNGFTWDNNEMTVWEDEENPVDHYTILNPSNNPNTDGYYDNLRWNETNESILIRIYVKAEETEDSLKVVYYDELFDVTLSEFNISVPSGHNFNENIVVKDSETPGTLPAYVNEAGETVAGRVNADGYGIVNTIPKTQNFETVLANVAVTNNRYNPELYKYTGTVVSEDGKTMTHYYNIDQSAFSPNFVADFGLPITFPLSDVVKEGISTVESVTVTPTTKYGTLSYDSEKKEFTYTPTQILPTVDVLSIHIKFDGQTTATTTNVGVTPATTVYYGEQFINFGDGWSAAGTDSVTNQVAEVLGSSTDYGYDGAYAGKDGASYTGATMKTTAKGATGTFAFTGTGIQVYAKTADEGVTSSYVSVMVQDSDGKIVKLFMVNTARPTDPTGELTGLPIVSLQGLTHGAYTVTINKIMDSNAVYIDGIRVFNTVADSSIYAGDLEDNPEYYELRDSVLNAINISDTTSKDYGTLAEMADQIYAGLSTDTEAPVALITENNIENIYGEDSTAQDLLDNGPKNELYLYAGQTLTFKVTTKRIMQIGLKAPQGATAATITVNGEKASQTVNSSVDMFYSVVSFPATSATKYTVSITNNAGTGVLSVTLLKVCDDPNFAFTSLTEEDIENLLTDVYDLYEEEEIPEDSSEPENVPTIPSKDDVSAILEGVLSNIFGDNFGSTIVSKLSKWLLQIFCR